MPALADPMTWQNRSIFDAVDMVTRSRSKAIFGATCSAWTGSFGLVVGWLSITIIARWPGFNDGSASCFTRFPAAFLAHQPGGGTGTS
jgi:hypothetical protein